MIDELLHPLETLPTGVERHAAASALRDAVRADISPWVPHLERLLALAPASYQTFETVMVESYDGFGHATGYSFPEDHVTDHPDPLDTMIAQLRPRCETAFVEALCRAPSRYPRLVAMYRTSTPPDALAAVLAAVTVLPLDDAMPLFEILQMQPWERSVPPTAIPPGLGRALFAWSRRPPDPTELLVNHYEQLVPRLCRVLAEADRRVLEDELADAVITSDPESTFAPVWRAIAGDAHVHWRRLVSLAFIPVVAELVRARLAASEAKRPSGFEAFLRDVQK